ncbi:MAG: hydrogenase maturation protein [Inquilinus sp.]|nr:hydrogenase maturation protein [Inquilinus sp.]
MRILFLVSGFNGLAQRLHVELTRRGHDVAVELDIDDATTQTAVEAFRPDLIVAPFLKRAIPASIWRHTRCLIVHPGIPGDKGPSSLDWAILNGEEQWGVTVLQAEAKMDSGPIWAAGGFPMRPASKSSLYRNEVTEAAVDAVLSALERLERGEGPPPAAEVWTGPRGIARPPVRQLDRSIDWTTDDTATVLRKIRSADGAPGVKDSLFGRTVFLTDARPAEGSAGEPGAIVAHSGPAVCRTTTDGAVWIGHARDKDDRHPFKLPAVRLFADMLDGVPEVPVDDPKGYREIRYEERNGVGTLHFDFHNGAMGTEQCERLLAAYRRAQKRDTKVIVLAGGPECWSNGIHLNLIEAADSPAGESWRNINAIDDLAEAIITTGTHLTVAALQGGAGAGGVFLARAADQVWLRSGIVLMPHYKDMGHLYGSEFWTYLLPRHAGEANAERIVEQRLPMGAEEAVALGLADERFDGPREAFLVEVAARAEALAADGHLAKRLADKRAARAADEAEKPLRRYRKEELARMHVNFYGPNPSFHIARHAFVHKTPRARTPITIARHRDRRLGEAAAPARRAS